MKRLMLTTVLVFGGMLGAACADTDVFRDSLRPGGHDRGMAAKFADARRCGATRLNTFTDGPAFQQCMQSRGWVLDHVVADRTAATFIDPDTGLSCHNQGGASLQIRSQLHQQPHDEYLFELVLARSSPRGRRTLAVVAPCGT